jgi:hypothetical protein
VHVEDTPALLEELRHAEHSGVVTATGEGAEGAEASAEEGAAGGEGAAGAEADAEASAEAGAEGAGGSSSNNNYYTLMQRQARHA